MTEKKKVQKHIHKLKRHTYKSTGNRIYFCTLPECNFKSEIEFMLGKEVICNRCGKPFEMNAYSLRLAKPHCGDCHNANRTTGHGGDRRLLPTRREVDPTVLPQVAASTIQSLQERLEGKEEAKISSSFKTLFNDDDSDDSELL